MHDVSGKESRARELSGVCIIMAVYSASQFHLSKLDNEAVMEDFLEKKKCDMQVIVQGHYNVPQL